MPRLLLMSWEKSRRRWTKMYKGQRYTVAPSVLGAPPTLEGSHQQANEWWRRKQAEIDGAGPHAEAIAETAARLEYARQHGLDEAKALEGHL